MKAVDVGKSGLLASEISLGCMRITDLDQPEVDLLLEAAIEVGIDFFDHADVYGGGKSEELFADALRRSSIAREKIIIQSKCGIRPGMFDFSRQHILSAVDGSLSRLQTDYLDVLLRKQHESRPDRIIAEICRPEDYCQSTAAELNQYGHDRQRYQC